MTLLPCGFVAAAPQVRYRRDIAPVAAQYQRYKVRLPGWARCACARVYPAYHAVAQRVKELLA